jgi:anti-sigma B factor antagonist
MKIHGYDFNDDLYKISLAGRLDFSSVTETIESESFSRMCSTPKKGIILDLSEVIFIASVGIRMLLIGCKLINNLGGKVAMVVPRQEIKNVLKVSGFDRVIEVFDDVNSAVESIN